MPIEKEYYKVDAQQWENVKRAATEWGIPIQQDAGQSEAYGVSVAWSRGPSSLKVKILSSTILPEQQAFSFLDTIIQTARG